LLKNSLTHLRPLFHNISASEVTTLWRYTNLFIIIIILTPVLNSQGMKKYAMQYKQVQKSSWNEHDSSSLLLLLLLLLLIFSGAFSQPVHRHLSGASDSAIRLTMCAV